MQAAIALHSPTAESTWPESHSASMKTKWTPQGNKTKWESTRELK